MEAFLGVITDNFPQESVKIEFKDRISLEQFQSVENAVIQLEELRNLRRLLKLVTLNDEEIKELLSFTVSKFAKKSTTWNGVGIADIEVLFLNINRLLFNYLSSIRTFLDHSETYLNRKFSEKSSKFQDFKIMLSCFYDNSFAYRFFYKLRNYAQHCGLPLDCVQFNLNYQHDYQVVEGKLKITFNKNILLKKF